MVERYAIRHWPEDPEVIPSPVWTWSKAGWKTERAPRAEDVLASDHPDVVRLRSHLSVSPADWPGWYPEARALVEGNEEGFTIAFYACDVVAEARRFALTVKVHSSDAESA